MEQKYTVTLTKENCERKLGRDAEAQLIAVACSNPPEGYSKWPMRFLL